LPGKTGWILLRSDGVVLEKGEIGAVSQLGECLLKAKSCEFGGAIPRGEPLYVRTHLGLGDLIICQAIFRCLGSNPRRTIHIFTKPKFGESVRFLCRDLPHLKIMEMDDPEVEAFLKTISLRDQVVIGHDFLPFFLQQKLAFDEAFYEIAGLKFSRRWSDFTFRRDPEAEKKIFDHFGVRKGGYVFLHEDASRKLKIDRAWIQHKDLQVVEPKAGLTGNAFDYLSLMEQAREIHCIDSSFRLMADSVFAPRPGLFFHQKLRDGAQKDTLGLFSSSRLNWKVI